MIPLQNCSNYIVYLPNSEIVWLWTELDAAFQDPFGRGMLKNPERYAELGWIPALDSYELIDGIYGNGIIRYIWPSTYVGKRYLWQMVLRCGQNHCGGANMPIVPGLYEPAGIGVSYLEEIQSGAVRMGLRKRKTVHPPRFSHIVWDMTVPAVFVGIAVLKSSRPPCSKLLEELLLSCLTSFGINCQIETPPARSTLDCVYQRLPKSIDQIWLKINGPLEDVPFLVAAVLYSTCADAKLLRKICGVHLVTQPLSAVALTEPYTPTIARMVPLILNAATASRLRTK